MAQVLKNNGEGIGPVIVRLTYDENLLPPWSVTNTNVKTDPKFAARTGITNYSLGIANFSTIVPDLFSFTFEAQQPGYYGFKIADENIEWINFVVTKPGSYSADYSARNPEIVQIRGSPPNPTQFSPESLIAEAPNPLGPFAIEPAWTVPSEGDTSPQFAEETGITHWSLIKNNLLPPVSQYILYFTTTAAEQAFLFVDAAGIPHPKVAWEAGQNTLFYDSPDPTLVSVQKRLLSE